MKAIVTFIKSSRKKHGLTQEEPISNQTMTNKAKVLYGNQMAGYLEKTDYGYSFTYDQEYLESEHPKPVSQTLPLSPYTYTNRTLFPFFDGLIP